MSLPTDIPGAFVLHSPPPPSLPPHGAALPSPAPPTSRKNAKHPKTIPPPAPHPPAPPHAVVHTETLPPDGMTALGSDRASLGGGSTTATFDDSGTITDTVSDSGYFKQQNMDGGYLGMILGVVAALVIALALVCVILCFVRRKGRRAALVAMPPLDGDKWGPSAAAEMCASGRKPGRMRPVGHGEHNPELMVGSSDRRRQDTAAWLQRGGVWGNDKLPPPTRRTSSWDLSHIPSPLPATNVAASQHQPHQLPSPAKVGMTSNMHTTDDEASPVRVARM